MDAARRGAGVCGLKPAPTLLDEALAAKFAPVAEALAANEKAIVDELIAVQGKPADIGGYYLPDNDKLHSVMCPSPTFNTVIASAA